MAEMTGSVFQDLRVWCTVHALWGGKGRAGGDSSIRTILRAYIKFGFWFTDFRISKLVQS